MAYSLTLVVLSGAIAAGKTTLARNLRLMLSAEDISTSALIRAMASRELARSELQQIGLSARLQGGGWIVVRSAR